MSYSYQTERPWLFTEEGQTCLLKARDRMFDLLDLAGAANGFACLKDVHCADSWKMLAIIDRMVEMGDIKEVTKSSEVRGQDRVFVRAR